MSRIVFAPDTNFFLNNPDFVSFFGAARSVVHLDILWPVLCELDRQRKRRFDNRQELQEKGQKAAKAIKLIKQLLENPTDDLELEIYRPEGIDSSLDPDAQIVDCIVQLASQHHADDTIEFITDDDGLPTVLFIQEKKRRGLKNVTIRTAEQVQDQVTQYGSLTAQIERIRISPKPTNIGKERGVELFVDVLLGDMKGHTAQVGIYTEGPQAVIHQNLAVTTAICKVHSLKFLLPYTLLGVSPKRFGVAHLKIRIFVWHLETRAKLTQADNYSIDFALGGHYLTKQA